MLGSTQSRTTTSISERAPPLPFSGSSARLAERIAPDRIVAEVGDESELRGARSTHGAEGRGSAARLAAGAAMLLAVDLGEQAHATRASIRSTCLRSANDCSFSIVPRRQGFVDEPSVLGQTQRRPNGQLHAPRLVRVAPIRTRTISDCLTTVRGRNPGTQALRHG